MQDRPVSRRTSSWKGQPFADNWSFQPCLRTARQGTACHTKKETDCLSRWGSCRIIKKFSMRSRRVADPQDQELFKFWNILFLRIGHLAPDAECW